MCRYDANEARQKDISILVTRLYNMILVNDGSIPNFVTKKDNISQAMRLIFSPRGEFLPKNDIQELRELLIQIKIDIIRDEMDAIWDEHTGADDKELITNMRDKCNEMLDAMNEQEEIAQQ